MGITFGSGRIGKKYLLGRITKYIVLCPYCGSDEVVEHRNCIVYFMINTGDSEIQSCSTVRYFCGKCGKIIESHYVTERGYD